MELIQKVFTILSVPLKVLLPSMSLFSGFMLFAKDAWLEKLNLLEWSQENGFSLGIMFVLSSVVILVYVVMYLYDNIVHFGKSMTKNYRNFKKFMKLNGTEQAVILGLYHSPTYTRMLDFNQPIIQSLVARGYIFTGRTQIVQTSILNPSLPMKVTLGSSMREALDEYIPRTKKEIDKLKKKIIKSKKPQKQKKYQEKLEIMQYYYDAFTDASIYGEAY